MRIFCLSKQEEKKKKKRKYTPFKLDIVKINLLKQYNVFRLI